MTYPTHEEIVAIYAARDSAVSGLKTRDVIEIEDIQSLDRLGRCRVANELWGKCSLSTQESLKNDVHHSVRSCAVMAEQNQKMTMPALHPLKRHA